jgi:hypothetical protein
VEVGDVAVLSENAFVSLMVRSLTGIALDISLPPHG